MLTLLAVVSGLLCVALLFVAAFAVWLVLTDEDDDAWDMGGCDIHFTVGGVCQNCGAALAPSNDSEERRA